MEEQFYVVFPIYLLLIARFDRQRQAAITTLLWFAGLAASVAIVAYDQSLAFFTLPTRIWELLTGTLLAMGILSKPRSILQARIACWAGLSIIAATVILYWERIAFPGLAALPPVAGAALVLWAGSASPTDQPSIMSSPGLINLGKISYPLYLWHFPLIGFTKYVSIGPVSPWVMSSVVGISFIVSWLSWRLLETPVRAAGQKFNAAFVLGSGTAVMAMIGGFGLVGFFARGFESRISPERLVIVRGMTDRSQAARDCMNRRTDFIRAGDLCTLGSAKTHPDTLVWGDSFAEALAPGIAAASDRAGKRFYLAGRHGCTPKIAAGADAACRDFNSAIMDWLSRSKEVRNVVLVLRWPSAGTHLKPRPDKADAYAATLAQIGPSRFSADLAALLDALSANGKTIWITGPLPISDYNVPRALYIQSLGFGTGMDVRPQRRDHDAAFGWIGNYIKGAADHADVRMIRLEQHFCDHSFCKVSENNYPLYFDSNHLTIRGANLISDEFEVVFR